MARGAARRRRGGVAASIGASASGVFGVGLILLGKLVVARRLVFDPARQLLGVSKRDIVQIVRHTCFGIKKCGIVQCRAEIKFDQLVDA